MRNRRSASREANRLFKTYLSDAFTQRTAEYRMASHSGAVEGQSAAPRTCEPRQARRTYKLATLPSTSSGDCRLVVVGHQRVPQSGSPVE